MTYGVPLQWSLLDEPLPSFAPCSHESDATIHSFGWSDFPLIGDGLSSVPKWTEEITNWDVSCSKTNTQEMASDCSDDTSSTASIESNLSDLEESTAAAAAQISPKKVKRVRFSHIMQVRTHQVVLGDHPCCSGGMALECGWRHSSTELLDLDVYEELHAPRRRHMMELRLCYGERRARLEANMGLTGAELLRLEYELFCCNEAFYQGQASPLRPNSNGLQWRPIHHAGSFPNFLSQQPSQYIIMGQH